MITALIADITMQADIVTALVCRLRPEVHRAEEDITDADVMDVGKINGIG